MSHEVKLISTKFDDVKFFKPTCFDDKRGFFRETYNQEIQSLIGEEIQFIQDNESCSRYGVLRGLHFQNIPFQQSKLVRVSYGEIQDVIVDIRIGSNTYGAWESFILSSNNNRFLFIPKGFAHGFLVLSSEAIVNYKTDSYYNSNAESGILYNDSKLDIQWKLPEEDIIISSKDEQLSKFQS